MLLPTLLMLSLATTPEAQAPAPPEAPPAAERPAAPAPPPAAEPCPAEDDYAAGFDALAQGEDARALEALERVLAACPQHPYAAELARMARARLRPGGRLAQAAVTGPEAPTATARASLTVVQTLHGATQGILLCVIADCGGQATVGLSLLGAGAGAASSLLLTRGGLTPGQASAINSGTLWGFWYGLALAQASAFNSTATLTSVVLGAAGLTGAGLLLSEFLQPTAGQVSMANSGGLWAGVVTTFFALTLEGSSTQALFAVQATSTTVGLVTLALLSRQYTVSRGRMLLIDAGGVLGALLGASLIYLVAEDNPDAILVGTGVGTLGGLAAATYLTRGFDSPQGPQVALTPAVLGRDGAGVALVGRF